MDYQPRCCDCGIALCWSISIEEYEQYQKFWDHWKCKFCCANYIGQYKNFKQINYDTQH